MAGEAPLLTFDGRRSRGSFLIYNAVFFVILAVAGFGLLYGLGLGFTNSFDGLALNALMWVVAFFTGLILSIVWMLSLLTSIQRFHDTGHSGWWVLLRLVLGLNIFVWGYLFFASGTPGPNAYGDDPREANAL